jgi:phospholipid transport system transporter-binding protein
MLRLPQTLLHDTATATLAELLAAVQAESSASVAVDASALQRFDSTALAVLLELRRAALQAGKTLALQDMPKRLQDLAVLYGIAELLPTAA